MIMRCEKALGQLNARVDGEISLVDVAGLDSHLAECEACRSAADGLTVLDGELREGLLTPKAGATRLADQVIASLNVERCEPTAAIVRGISWAQALMAMAAGFLLAVILFRPWKTGEMEEAVIPAPEPIARLAVATGPVEMRPWKKLEFFACPTFTAIAKDSVVRTGPSARCELELKDGNSIVMDRDTEVTLRASDVVEVSRGRLSATSSPESYGCEVKSGGGTIVPKKAAEFAITCQSQGAQLVVVDGEVDVEAAGESVTVGAGKKVRIVEGKVVDEADWHDVLLETAWVNSILALRDTGHSELVDRVGKLLAKVGAAKLSLLYEDELRRLGDDGVPPLLAYLESTRESPDLAQRATAARIAADVAESRWIGDLIELLADANSEVRFHAARGLERLTGRDQGCDAATWRAGASVSCASAHERWVDWWQANRGRYLGEQVEGADRGKTSY
jgi:hypothetical protein